MKAVRLHEFGPAENFRWEDVPDPHPGSEEVVLRVGACGVCFHDVINRLGHLPRTKLPAILGHEVAGTIVAMGAGVAGFQLGDRVACLQRVNCGQCHFCTNSRPTLCRTGAVFFGEEIPGGYAEYFLAPARAVVKVPVSVPDEEACVTACTLGTAVHALGYRAAVRPGQTVLITGASGGVGIHAIQLARLQGANVVAVTSSAKKVEALKCWGAHTVIHSPKLEFAKEVKKLVGSVDVVLEVVGSPTLDQSLHVLEPGGRLVIIGNVVGARASFNPGLIILKELEVVGSFAVSTQELEDAFGLVAAGKIRIVISESFPLQDAAHAHKKLESRSVAGRLVLRPLV